MSRSDRRFAAALADKVPGRLASSALFHLLRNRSGTTAIELALVFPFFLMLLLGIVEFGQALRTWNEVHHALGRAVRLVNLNASTSPSEIENAMRSFLTQIDANALTVTATPVTVDNIRHITISVGFPIEISIPFTSQSTLMLSADRTTPVLSATK